ncbi:hypothetical protein ACQKOM_06435 [Peribacillus frigoritolerans]|uniref:hypothetical protein n=1 Tax=Peribacillus frigoritolerans TaxID=450367 RepID=UPI003D07B3F0
MDYEKEGKISNPFLTFWSNFLLLVEMRIEEDLRKVNTPVLRAAFTLFKLSTRKDDFAHGKGKSFFFGALFIFFLKEVFSLRKTHDH